MKSTTGAAASAPDADPPAAASDDRDADLTRRRLMAGLAKMGITTLAVGSGLGIVSYREEARAAAPAGSTGSTGTAKAARAGKAGRDAAGKPKRAWCMVIDLRVCDGCAACTMACRTRHELPPDHDWIKVYTMTDSHGGTYHMPRPCMMCEDPPCVKVCPVGANFRTDEGLVLVDQDVCVGSRICMAACPYDARYFNWQDPPPAKDRTAMARSPLMPVPQKKGTVGKCVLCADRLEDGELPVCVSACPMAALYIGDLVTDVAVNTRGNTVKLSTFLRDNDAVRFKEEYGTNPRVYYILGHGQNLEAQS